MKRNSTWIELAKIFICDILQCSKSKVLPGLPYELVKEDEMCICVYMPTYKKSQGITFPWESNIYYI